MISRTTRRFREALGHLPEQIRRQAREAYKLFQADPNHLGLRFKKVHATEPVYSVRVSGDYRALGAREGNEIVWFWIGSHANYEKLLNQL